MLGTPHYLKWLLLSNVLILSLSIGAEDWLLPILMVLNVYYFTFIMNLFFKLYETENFVTRILFTVTKTPIYIAATTLVIAIVFLRRLTPGMDINAAYLSAIIGIVATTIARIKKGELIRRP